MSDSHEATRRTDRFTFTQGVGVAAIVCLTWLLASSVVSNWSIGDASRPARSLVASLPASGQPAPANVLGYVSPPGLTGAAGAPVASSTAAPAQAIPSSEGGGSSVAPAMDTSGTHPSDHTSTALPHPASSASSTVVSQPAANAASAAPSVRRTSFRSADTSAVSGGSTIVGDANTEGLNPNGYPLNSDGMPIYPNSLHAPNSASLSGLDGSTQSAEQIAKNLVFPDGVPMPNVTPGVVPTNSDYYTPFIQAGLNPSAVYRPSDLSTTLNPQIMQALGYRMGTNANDAQSEPVWVGPLTPSTWYKILGN